MKYKPVIGLEIHAELKTKTKMFCDSLNDPDERHPNVNICPICMGHPGTLPAINEEAVRKLILVGKALNCKIAEYSKFDRKNYFYPDLPKGYQISQYDLPLCKNGFLEMEGKKIRIQRIHLEEDTGRLLHSPDGRHSLVDFNRAGVPLMELVTEPDLTAGQEVRKFAEELQLILRYLGVSDADMEKGQMRVEVNISLREILTSQNQKLGTKVEIKNLNSIKAASDAIDYEIKRQSKILDKGKRVIQETRGWDENKKETFPQRLKEEAQDYRYFPEPDLPPLSQLSAISYQLSAQLPELPQQRRKRFKEEYGLPDSDIEIFVVNKELGDFFENIISELKSWDKLSHLDRPSQDHFQKLIKLSANYLITELQKLIFEKSISIKDLKISAESFAEFVTRVYHQEVSSTAAQALLKEIFQTGEEPGHIIDRMDLGQVSDISELTLAIEAVIAENLKPVEDYKKGKKEALKFLIGKVMAKTRGKANPQLAGQILEKELGLKK